MSRSVRPDPPLLAIARRYEPLVISVTVILVALLVVPNNGAVVGAGPVVAAPAAPPPLAPPALPGPTEPVPLTRPPNVTAQPVPPAPAPVARPRPAPSAAPPAPPTQEPEPSPTVQPPMGDVIRVVEAGWTGNSSGVPLAGTDVPDGTLPVSVTLGSPDRRSLLRIEGRSTTLELAEHPDAIGTRFPDAAALWLCPLLSDEWEGTPNMAPDEAPEHDCEIHAVGVRVDEHWSFDLGVFGANVPTSLAVVPAEGAGDFQVLLSDPRT